MAIKTLNEDEIAELLKQNLEQHKGHYPKITHIKTIGEMIHFFMVGYRLYTNHTTHAEMRRNWLNLLVGKPIERVDVLKFDMSGGFPSFLAPRALNDYRGTIYMSQPREKGNLLSNDRRDKPLKYIYFERVCADEQLAVYRMIEERV